MHLIIVKKYIELNLSIDYIKKINEKELLKICKIDFINKTEYISKTMLAKRTKLSRATIQKLINP